MTKARDLANASTALSAVSATELGYVDGVTSAIQTQLDAKIAKTLTTTTGDIIYASGANTPARLGIGSTAQVLTVAAGVPSWATPAAPAFVGCQLRKSADQLISNNTDTATTFDTEDIDTDGFHSNATNTSRITIPAGKSGKYLVIMQTRFEANSTGRRLGKLFKNGSIDSTFQFEAVPSSTGAVTMGNSFFMNLVATDYIEIFSFQNSGGSLNITNTGVFFGVQYLGA